MPTPEENNKSSYVNVRRNPPRKARTNNPSLHYATLLTFLVIISTISAHNQIPMFFSFDPKPEYPIFLCGSPNGPFHRLAPETDCFQLPCHQHIKSQTQTAEFYRRIHPAFQTPAVYYFRKMETCRFEMFFFGAQVPSCRDELVEISFEECSRALRLSVNSDGPLSSLGRGLQGIRNTIDEEYHWPRTKIIQKNNTFLQDTAIFSSSTNGPLVSSIRGTAACHIQDGYCPVGSHGFLL